MSRPRGKTPRCSAHATPDGKREGQITENGAGILAEAVRFELTNGCPLPVSRPVQSTTLPRFRRDCRTAAINGPFQVAPVGHRQCIGRFYPICRAIPRTHGLSSPHFRQPPALYGPGTPSSCPTPPTPSTLLPPRHPITQQRPHRRQRRPPCAPCSSASAPWATWCSSSQ